MKVKLRAGAELETLTRGELHDELHEAASGFLDELGRRGRGDPPRWVRPDDWEETDANGDATLTVFRVKQGMELRVQRVVVSADGYDAGTPHAGGGFELWRDGYPVAVQASNQLPAELVTPEGAGARFRNGDEVQVRVLAGPANTRVRAAIEGTLHIGAP